MSEYVEARYAKLILDEARLAEQDVASKLVRELLRDLSFPAKVELCQRTDSELDTIACAVP